MNVVKENFSTILLISFILITLLVIGFFVYKTSNASKNNDNGIDVVKVPEYVLTINDDNNSLEGKQENKKEIKQAISVNEKETKNNNYTLSEIANIFNVCDVTQQMRLQGYTMNAIGKENNITIFSGGEGISFNVEFMLKNNILSSEIMYDKNDPKITLAKTLLAVTLVDCVGQAKGYSEKVLSNALGEDKAMYYTIEKEGVEIKKLDNNRGISVKVDLNSNFPFLDI